MESQREFSSAGYGFKADADSNIEEGKITLRQHSTNFCDTENEDPPIMRQSFNSIAFSVKVPEDGLLSNRTATIIELPSQKADSLVSQARELRASRASPVRSPIKKLA